MTQTAPLVPITSAPDPEEEAPSALDRRPDGRIVVSFSEDLSVTLRRPTLGEFRKWRLLLTEIQDDALQLAARQAAEQAADDAAVKAEEMTVEEQTKRRLVRNTEQDEAGDLAAEVWWGQVFAALADQPVPPSDEWPPFLVYGTNVLPTVLAHWRNVPLAPGRRSNKIG